MFALIIIFIIFTYQLHFYYLIVTTSTKNINFLLCNIYMYTLHNRNIVDTFSPYKVI